MVDAVKDGVSAIGMLNYGESYLAAAYYLVEGDERGEVNLRFPAPVTQLAGHAIELFFKAMLRTASDEKHITHDLEGLLQKVEKIPEFSGARTIVDGAIKEFARRQVRQERLETESSLPPEFAEIVEVPSDTQIEHSLPKLHYVLKLLNDEVGKSPYRARYFKRGMKRLPDIWLVLCAASSLFELAQPICAEFSKKYEL